MDPGYTTTDELDIAFLTWSDGYYGTVDMNHIIIVGRGWTPQDKKVHFASFPIDELLLSNLENWHIWTEEEEILSDRVPL